MKNPREWTTLPFPKAVVRMRSHGTKVKAQDYKPSGRIPVVDQGQKLVVGFTDDERTQFQGPLPVIVFGDHTREVKFVDFNFAVGADGTVLLRTVPEIEPRFFFYWLQSATLHNLGYGRHYKLLAEQIVPVPPPAEQRRLVARIEALTSRAHELRNLNASLVDDATLLIAEDYNRITENAPMRPLGEVARLIRRCVETKLDGSYAELGIRSFGKGTFHKPALTGHQLGNKRVFRIHPGDLVFMNVFAWEGAIAVAKPEDKDRVGSHRFLAHEVDPEKATAEFLCYHLLTDHGLEHIRAASPGSAGRNRTLGITKLEKIPVPVPPIQAQRRFTALYAFREKLRRLQAETEAELAAFTPALLAKAFRGEL